MLFNILGMQMIKIKSISTMKNCVSIMKKLCNYKLTALSCLSDILRCFIV